MTFSCSPPLDVSVVGLCDDVTTDAEDVTGTDDSSAECAMLNLTDSIGDDSMLSTDVINCTKGG